MQVFLEAHRVCECKWKQINRGHEKVRMERWVAEDHQGAGTPDKTIGLLKQQRHWSFWAKMWFKICISTKIYYLKLFNGGTSYTYIRI